MGPTIREWPLEIDAAGQTLAGSLSLPQQARGLVIFAHGSGSSRLSPRNQRVARSLQSGGLATLLLDLLTFEEEVIDARTAQYRFDIELLAERVKGTLEWASAHNATAQLGVGLFGSSTGAAAALIAAAARPELVGAVVSRGGRPDLAEESLPEVRAPTLFIVGGSDGPVIRLNQKALDQMAAVRELRIIPGATHLFEEPGALDEVAALARDFFIRHLSLFRGAEAPTFGP
jgi:putative phosphoribosyl transferase